MRRVESASSINTFKQCPRKYFFRYIKKLPDAPSIATVKGNIVHSALENFFKLETSSISDYKKELPLKLESLYDFHWVASKEKLKQLKLDVSILNEHYLDGRSMINVWIKKLILKIDPTLSFNEAFEKIRPEVEMNFTSQKYGVTGFVDALYHKGKDLHVVDYKTSSKDIITPEYALQAGIYAVLIHEIRGVMPTIVSFDFLKGEFKDLIVDDALIKNTIFEIENMHASTGSDDPTDYRKKPSGLCKWSNAKGTGKCAYYDICKPYDP